MRLLEKKVFGWRLKHINRAARSHGDIFDLVNPRLLSSLSSLIDMDLRYAARKVSTPQQ